MTIIDVPFVRHPCYNGKRRTITPVGILLHCTGAVNRQLRRYVDNEDALGRNQYGNHWNKPDATKSVHAFVGYDKDNNVVVAETLPHGIACWGCGSGTKGSYNYDPHAYLQIEVCQGSDTDSDYYKAAITVAEEYCVHLCQMYGWTADNITSHAEAHKAGYASNHGDPGNWMRHFGDSMDSFRTRVTARLNGASPEIAIEPAEQGRPTLRKGDKGEDVVYLQERLNVAHPHDQVKVDGIFGMATLAAVRAYQYDHGLNADGIVGALTWAAIELEDTDEDEPTEGDEMVEDENLTLEERIARLEKAVFGE